MKRTVKSQLKSALAIACLGAAMATGLSAVPAMAQEEGPTPEQVRVQNEAALNAATREVDATTREAQAAQRRVNQIDDRIQQLTQEYRQQVELLEDLREYNALKRRIITRQEENIASLRRDIINVADIQRSMPPMISEMIDTVDAFIQKDLPFYPVERAARIARLRADFERSDVSTAEKYRKALEAYQIENDYGRAIEAYESKLVKDGRESTVNYLKVGRVALYYQSLDKSETGMWDAEAGQWTTDLPGGAGGMVETAISIANEFVPPDLILLPLPAPKDA